ncbi:sugar phosphate isomerase/epimerase family protein [Bacillus ndiopicus]|uniref:sugar phosphate isomerase/epimerase family protein n=1 Tax=Bacillus ndiopicus TaxID=1347368 RepID=UPI0005AA3FA5|nr:sugar phosphate isomerase/epimerase family protein [Bacillus ndiopicus]
MSFNMPNKIGVIVDSFRLPLKEGLQKAKELGADGVQIYAVSGELDPANIDKKGRDELKAYIDSLGLEISALCGDLGGHGFQDAKENASKIVKSKAILDLAKDLGTNIVTTHIGIVPDNEKDPIYQTMLKACEELGQYATSIGGYFAIETGPEKAATLKAFLDKLSTKGVSVNFDPANMVMVTKDDPVEGVKLLRDYIVHTHVKDGIQLQPTNPKDVYGYLDYGGETSHEKIAEMVENGEYFREVPLGQGAVNFDLYFQALQDIGYSGYLTIEREVKTNPTQDIEEAVKFIQTYK